VRAVELLHAIQVVDRERTVQADSGCPTNGRTKSGEHHVSAADLFLGCSNFGTRFLKTSRVQHLRHLLARLQSASECLIHELHGKILSVRVQQSAVRRKERCAHTSACVSLKGYDSQN
jgi:hypothetical protein